jgi:hypothetical protein
VKRIVKTKFCKENLNSFFNLRQQIARLLKDEYLILQDGIVSLRGRIKVYNII